MKSFVCLLASFCACAAFGGEFASPEPQSVLTVAPAAPCTACAQPAPALICVNGQCGSSRLYSVQSEKTEHCRNRLFGGHVVRKTQRTVVKPVRR